MSSTTANGIWGQKHRSFSCRKVENGYVVTLSIPHEKRRFDSTAAPGKQYTTYWNWEQEEHVARTEREVVDMISEYMLRKPEELRVKMEEGE